MSDEFCDPTFEDCSPAMEPMDGEMEAEEWPMEAEEPSRLNVSMDEIIYSMAVFAATVHGVQMYRWYPQMIKDDSVRFPDRDPDPSATQTSDEEWALGTKEISAWTIASYSSIALYGFQWLTWAANLLLDNEGGQLHYFTYKWRNLMWFAPAISALLAINVNTSYARSGYWYTNAVQDGVGIGSSSFTDVNERYWLFNPSETADTNYYYRDVDQVKHQQTYWVAIILIIGAYLRSMSVLDMEYEKAAYEKDLAEWMEMYGDEMADEDEAVEDDFQQEEQFFM